jgi:hypothetical protein
MKRRDYIKLLSGGGYCADWSRVDFKSPMSGKTIRLYRMGQAREFLLISAA